MRSNMQTVRRTNLWIHAVRLGFFAGLIWGTAKMFMHYFNMTEVHPTFLAEPFFRHEFLTRGIGLWIGFGFFILYSIAASVLYTLFLRKAKGPWLGIGYGAVWWAAIYVFLGPITGFMQPVRDWSFDTLTSDLCLFLLWGLFIGYSTAIEYTDERKRDSVVLW